MADLRELVGELGFADVRTVLQSGNIVFRAPTAHTALAASSIESALVERTGIQAAVLVVSVEDLRTIAKENPLLDVATDPARLLVTFLGEPVDAARIEVPEAGLLVPEAVRVSSRAVYQWCPNGVLASKLPASFWRQFDPRATSRNWRTVQRLIDVAR
jgi:uncharacterized protein (DUF1697 family)